MILRSNLRVEQHGPEEIRREEDPGARPAHVLEPVLTEIEPAAKAASFRTTDSFFLRVHGYGVICGGWVCPPESDGATVHRGAGIWVGTRGD